MTRQHTAYRQGEKCELFKDAVLEFTDAAVSMGSKSTGGSNSKSDSIQIGSVGQGGVEAHSWGGSASQSGYGQASDDAGNIRAVAGAVTCYNCGGRGHVARDCPSEGKGKSPPQFGYGAKKGGAKGKGFEKGGNNQGKRKSQQGIRKDWRKGRTSRSANVGRRCIKSDC